jgi:hypothetical protein
MRPTSSSVTRRKRNMLKAPDAIAASASDPPVWRGYGLGPDPALEPPAVALIGALAAPTASLSLVPLAERPAWPAAAPLERRASRASFVQSARSCRVVRFLQVPATSAAGGAVRVPAETCAQDRPETPAKAKAVVSVATLSFIRNATSDRGGGTTVGVGDLLGKAATGGCPPAHRPCRGVYAVVEFAGQARMSSFFHAVAVNLRTLGCTRSSRACCFSDFTGP